MSLGGGSAAGGWAGLDPLLLLRLCVATLLAALLLLARWRAAALAEAEARRALALRPAEPYPGYHLRHGRSAGMKSVKHGCHGLSAKELGAGGVVIVDVNNVRGKFGFGRADTIAFCGAVNCWARANGLEGQVQLAVDHGPRQAVVSAAGSLFCFSGPRLEADDTIVFDIQWFLRKSLSPVVVVTSDRDLKRRCRAQLNAYLEQHSEAAGALGEGRQLLRIIDSGAFAGWVSTSGWPEYQANCCVDGLCKCTPAPSTKEAGAGGPNHNHSGHGRPRKQAKNAVIREYTADRVRLAHRCFDVARAVSQRPAPENVAAGGIAGSLAWMAACTAAVLVCGADKPSQRGTGKSAWEQWHREYMAWVEGGRVGSKQEDRERQHFRNAEAQPADAAE